jgi:hypothetical protein
MDTKRNDGSDAEAATADAVGGDEANWNRDES